MLRTRKKLFLMILISNIILITGAIVAYALYTDAYGASCNDAGGFPTNVTSFCNHIWSSNSGEGQINWSYYSNLYHNGSLVGSTANSGNGSSPYYDYRGVIVVNGSVPGLSGGHFTNSSHFSSISQLNPPFGSVSDGARAYCWRSSD